MITYDVREDVRTYDTNTLCQRDGQRPRLLSDLSTPYTEPILPRLLVTDFRRAIYLWGIIFIVSSAVVCL